MGKIISFLLLATFLAANPVPARTVKVAVDATWPPMEFLDDSKQLVGFDVDFMRAVARETGFEVTFENVAWTEIFEGLQAGKYDAVCSSVAISEERARIMDFSLPYFWDRNVRQALLIRKDSTQRTLTDLNGKMVGAQAGTTGFLAVTRTGTVTAKPYDDIGAAIQALVDKNIDGVVCDDPVASALLRKNKAWANHLEIGSLVQAELEYYGVVVKKGNKPLLGLIDKGIEAVQAKGIDVQLRKKWLAE
jgi:polar amino acid transport system substrate-binding protein